MHATVNVTVFPKALLTPATPRVDFHTLPPFVSHAWIQGTRKDLVPLMQGATTQEVRYLQRLHGAIARATSTDIVLPFLAMVTRPEYIPHERDVHDASEAEQAAADPHYTPIPYQPHAEAIEEDHAACCDYIRHHAGIQDLMARHQWTLRTSITYVGQPRHA